MVTLPCFNLEQQLNKLQTEVCRQLGGLPSVIFHRTACVSADSVSLSLARLVFRKSVGEDDLMSIKRNNSQCVPDVFKFARRSHVGFQTPVPRQTTGIR